MNKDQNPDKGKDKGKQTPNTETPEPTVEALQAQLKEATNKLENLNEKYQFSSREGEKIPKLVEQVEELKAKLRDKAPSEPPLEKRVPNWDDLTPEEQQEYRDKDKDKKKLREIEKSLTEERKAREFDEGFEGIIGKDEFKALAAQKAAFREFYKENPGMQIEAVAKSFLFDSVKELAAKEEREKMGRKGLEVSSGGERTPSTPDEGYTAEEIAHLRETNYKKYSELVSSGKLKFKKE